MLNQEVTVGKSGRIVIPAACRKELNLKEGDKYTLKIKDGDIYLLNKKKSLEKIRAYMKTLKKPGESMVDEFLKFRKEDSGDL